MFFQLKKKIANTQGLWQKILLFFVAVHLFLLPRVYCQTLHVMILEHVAIWVHDLEGMKDYYSKYFNGRANTKYHNSKTGFESYFLTFESGARLELMKRPVLADNLNDPVNKQHFGIIHVAFGVETAAEVDRKARQLQDNGFKILRGPRKTGDGYYEFETLDGK